MYIFGYVENNGLFYYTFECKICHYFPNNLLYTHINIKYIVSYEHYKYKHKI